MPSNLAYVINWPKVRGRSYLPFKISTWFCEKALLISSSFFVFYIFLLPHIFFFLVPSILFFLFRLLVIFPCNVQNFYFFPFLLAFSSFYPEIQKVVVVCVPKVAAGPQSNSNKFFKQPSIFKFRWLNKKNDPLNSPLA